MDEAAKKSTFFPSIPSQSGDHKDTTTKWDEALTEENNYNDQKHHSKDHNDAKQTRKTAGGFENIDEENQQSMGRLQTNLSDSFNHHTNDGNFNQEHESHENHRIERRPPRFFLHSLNNNLSSNSLNNDSNTNPLYDEEETKSEQSEIGGASDFSDFSESSSYSDEVDPSLVP